MGGKKEKMGNKSPENITIRDGPQYSRVRVVSFISTSALWLGQLYTYIYKTNNAKARVHRWK